MANKLTFPFVEKEGKHFAPIVQSVPKYIIRDGAIREDGIKIIGGTKGVFAKVRLQINTTQKAELFAVNTEFYQSSN